MTMYDVAIELANRPGALADLGDALGRAGVSVEGGGAWVVGAAGFAHFLVVDSAAAVDALGAAEISVRSAREVVQLRLDQARPGQLGLACRQLADAGVNIEALYSDHAGALVLVVDDSVAGRRVADGWNRRS
jgi:hypothetical protein